MPLAGSVLVHGALALLIVLAALERRRPPEPLPPPAFAVVFSGGSAAGPTAPERGPQPAEAEVAAEPPPPPPTVPPVPPPPRTVPPAPVAQPVVPPPPAPPPPAHQQQSQALAALPVPARPPPPPRPPQPLTGFLDLSGTPPIRLPPPMERVVAAPPAPPRRPGTLHLSPGAVAPGPTNVLPMARIEGAEVGADWRNAFRAWLEANKRYPREAIEQGEDGTLQLHLVVEADGRVRVVDLRRPSRSFWLNRSAVAMFRGATLPPFPPGTVERSVRIDLTINYILIR